MELPTKVASSNRVTLSASTRSPAIRWATSSPRLIMRRTVRLLTLSSSATCEMVSSLGLGSAALSTVMPPGDCFDVLIPALAIRLSTGDRSSHPIR